MRSKRKKAAATHRQKTYLRDLGYEGNVNFLNRRQARLEISVLLRERSIASGVKETKYRDRAEQVGAKATSPGKPQPRSYARNVNRWV